MRYEVRVRHDGGIWEVRAGDDGPVQRFASRDWALNRARELARLAWVERATLSCVKALTPAGTWETVDVFGVSLLGP